MSYLYEPAARLVANAIRSDMLTDPNKGEQVAIVLVRLDDYAALKDAVLTDHHCDNCDGVGPESCLFNINADIGAKTCG